MGRQRFYDSNEDLRDYKVKRFYTEKTALKHEIAPPRTNTGVIRIFDRTD